ncbi:MAG: hypothetical protein ACRDZ8_04145 [Acidimicrobiales bacterium]
MANLPQSAASQLSFYTDTYRTLTPVLAPKGWSCQAQLGEDGSSAINVYPSGTTATSAAEAVTTSNDGACQDCVYGLVCALIPTARPQLGYTDMPCNASVVKGEAVQWDKGWVLSSPPINDVISFEDPASVKGTGTPSGGVNPANGVLLYRFKSINEGQASVQTCTLPSAEHELCTAVLNDFINRAWQLYS